MAEDMSDDKHKTNLRKQIDENLKRVYEDQLTLDVPDRFTELLNQLRKTEETQ